MGLMVRRYTLGDSPDNLNHGVDCGTIQRKFDPRGFSDPVTGRMFPKYYGEPNVWLNTDAEAFDNGGVHFNCAVMNFWFYLLTNGGSGTINTSINVNSIGYDKAAQIVYRAMDYGYFTRNSMFSDARDAAMRAARELYGDCSMEEIEVSKAWTAVGIGGVKVCPVTVTGHTDLPNGTICLPLAQNYAFQAFEFTNSTFSWSVPTDWNTQISGNSLQVYSFGSAMSGQYQYATVTSNLTQQTGVLQLYFQDGCGM